MKEIDSFQEKMQLQFSKNRNPSSYSGTISKHTLAKALETKGFESSAFLETKLAEVEFWKKSGPSVLESSKAENDRKLVHQQSLLKIGTRNSEPLHHSVSFQSIFSSLPIDERSEQFQALRNHTLGTLLFLSGILDSIKEEISDELSSIQRIVVLSILINNVHKEVTTHGKGPTPLTRTELEQRVQNFSDNRKAEHLKTATLKVITFLRACLQLYQTEIEKDSLSFPELVNRARTIVKIRNVL